MKTYAVRLLLMALILALAACETTGHRNTSAEALVPPLLKLTAATTGVVRYGDPNARASGEQLLQEAMKDKPELQNAFRSGRLTVRYDLQNVVILVSPRSGTNAWLEDASWTPLFVDKKHYLSNPPSSAQFSIPLP